jgi:hypothetical protein
VADKSGKPLLLGHPHGFSGEARFADASLAGDERRRSAAGVRCQGLHLGVAADLDGADSRLRGHLTILRQQEGQ